MLLPSVTGNSPFACLSTLIRPRKYCLNIANVGVGPGAGRDVAVGVGASVSTGVVGIGVGAGAAVAVTDGADIVSTNGGSRLEHAYKVANSIKKATNPSLVMALTFLFIKL